MKKNGLLAVVLSLILVIGMLSISGQGLAETPAAGDGKAYILNFKSELATEWEEVAATFTSETGIPMKVVTAGSGTYGQTLRSELAKSEPPTLFNIGGPIDYITWKDYCDDLSSSKIYEWLLDKSLAITSEGGVYGVPYTVETYGIIYNDEIMRRYFALADKAVALTDAKEIKSFADLKAVVEDMTAKKDVLGIEGVFGTTSFSPGEDWRWQTHLANLPIYYEYQEKGVNDLAEIDFSYNQNYKNVFDLYINNSVTAPKMVGAKNVEDSMAEFALGKAAMIQNGNWGWAMIKDVPGTVVKEEDIKFMPIYTGVEGEEKQGLCTGTENFICVNSQISDADKAASHQFLEWLFGSETGKELCVGKLGMASPFSTFTADERPSNPLALEMFSYMDDPELTSVSWVFATFPSSEFKNQFGADLYEYTLGNMEWESLVEDVKAAWASEKAAITQ